MGLSELPWLAPLEQRFKTQEHLGGHWAIQGYCAEELAQWADFMVPLLSGSALNVMYPEVDDLLLWVRDLPHRLATRATEGKGVWVVYFDSKIVLTEVVQNALLKVVEEPPTPTQFVFCSTRPDFLLATLKSRCQTLRLPRPTTAAALAYVAARVEEGVDAAECLNFASGKPLEALVPQKKGDLTVPQQLQILARQCRLKGDWHAYRYVLEQGVSFQVTPHLNAELFMAIVKERCAGV